MRAASKKVKAPVQTKTPLLLLSCALSALGCDLSTDASDPDDVGADYVEADVQPLVGGIDPGSCDYITCGQNTRQIGNGFVDMVRLDGGANGRGQRLERWVAADRAPLTGELRAEWSFGPNGFHIRYGVYGVPLRGAARTGGDLVGSVMTLRDRNGGLLQLRIEDSREVELPNGTWQQTYRFHRRSGTGRFRDLCEPFEKVDQDLAYYAFIGAREQVHASSVRVSAKSLSQGFMTIGCPNTATGKLLSLGALTTTAAPEEMPKVVEMTAALKALALAADGRNKLTRPGIGAYIAVRRTGVKNTGSTFSGELEAKWGAAGALCFNAMRLGDEDFMREVKRTTGIQNCADVTVNPEDVLVTSHLFFRPPGSPTYPDNSPILKVPVFKAP